MKIEPEKLLASGIPPRALNAFRTMKGATGEYLTAYQCVCDQLSHGSIIGLLGPRGVGKTVMAVGFLNSVITAGRSVLYVTAHELFMRYKGSYRPDASETESEVHETFKKTSLLVIDEIGRRQESDWENRTLFDLLDKRYGWLRDTILISNQEKSVFDDAVGDSVVSRMNESGGFIECNWPSFRV